MEEGRQEETIVESLAATGICSAVNLKKQERIPWRQPRIAPPRTAGMNAGMSPLSAAA